MKQRLILIGLALWLLVKVYGQDRAYAKWLIDTLSSPAFHGRGYVHDGMGKAARFLEAEMQGIGLKPAGIGYLQTFGIPVNTFPGPVDVAVDGKSLAPGRDFIVAPNAPSLQGTFPIKAANERAVRKRHFTIKKRNEQVFTVVPAPGDDKGLRAFSDSLRYGNPFGGKGVIRLSDRKVHWSMSGSMPPREYVMLDVRQEAWPKKAKRLQINLQSKPVARYEVNNVFGFIPGDRSQDTIILFTAHYDHLGMMGSEALFAGANDNASGTAMIMDLARYFMENKPAWSVGFLACAAEESGLHGSEYFAANPLVPIESIAFVINLDMVGTGSAGIRVVNGTTWPEAFQMMESINQRDSLLVSVTAGGVSKNSDHYPFHKRGVPAFFIFTRGDEFREYHNLDDRAEDLPLTKYNEVFSLLRQFAETLMQP